MAENGRTGAVAVKSERGRRGRPGLRGLIAVRVRPPMIRGHLTRDLERWLAPPNFSRFDAHSPKTGRLLARCNETGFKVSRLRHLVSGGARLLRASGSSVPPDCNASWPGRKLILKSCRTNRHLPVRQDPIVRPPIGAATFCLENSRRRKADGRKLLIRMGKWRVTGRSGLRKTACLVGFVSSLGFWSENRSESQVPAD